ncbi:MAG: xenobiotic ABC transporter ATP-binding protein [Candidatus Binatia bacterium]|nr:MAG: xenobiotic ABC transporter ATP-binding protein [Candidatus Binatia bacterium]
MTDSASERYAEQELGKAYDLRILGRLWGYMRPYRRTFWLAVLFLPASSVAMLAQPYILKVAIDRYIAQGHLDGLFGCAALFAAAIVAEFAFQYGQYVATMSVAQRSLADLRHDLFAHVERLPVSFFDRNPVGRIVTRLTTDVDGINEMFAAGAMTILMDLLTLVGIVAILVAIDWRLALVTFSVLPVLLLAVDFFRRQARESYRRIRERLARLNSYLQECISGVRVVQLFAREDWALRTFDRLNDAHRLANHRSNIYEAALFSLVEALSSVAFALIVWYGGGQILAGTLAFGTLVAFLEYIQKFFVPIRDFSTKYAVLQSAMASAERVFQLLDTPAEGRARSRPAAGVRGDTAPSPEGRAPSRPRGEVVFDGVWFAYKEGEWVLRDVSFRVDPGETVALVGPTGAGKTTVIKLLTRFYDPQKGRIFVDGVEVRDWDLEELRRRIGVVFQDVFLFSGTIADNIRLGDDRISDERIREVARRVHVLRIVERLPRGFREPVQERGANFSAGERQLLAFARALAFDPEILVLDEATANVDPETELWIQDALEKLFRERTSIVIAHRLSTIERAQRIVVLHGGTVRETGTHESLLRARGLYWRLHELQYAREPAPRRATADG